jgi:putative flavoprotein involved in K+ transport
MTTIDPARHHYPVLVVGGGQAGLSMSYCLKQQGIDHLVFEKHRRGHIWSSERWDSFCLVTPNWQCQLPGFPYNGSDPFGFMKKDEILAYIDAYVDLIQPPLLEGVEVKALRRFGAGFELETSIGTYTADQVVLAVGGYHIPSIPRIAERLPTSVLQLHSSEYRNADALPPGAVLVVGSGQSGCQIAEDLHLAGRQTHLCVGSAPRVTRRYRGKDVVEWLHDMGHYDMPIDQHPLKEKVRGKANHYVTGRDGGRDIDLRKFALEGMKLYGRLGEAQGSELRFAPDLSRNLDGADATAERIKAGIDAYIAANGIEAPVEAPYVPLWAPESEPAAIDLAAENITTVIWSTGFRSNFTWVEIPAFDGRGYPTHKRGVSTVPGLYFLGLPWLYTWGSGRFSGIARDAGYLADQIADCQIEPKRRAAG